jgi:hypothetical protein
MEIQKAVGKLTEAVESLKTQSQRHDDKLDQIGKDVHAAKIVGGVIVLVGGLLGWIIHELLPVLSSLKPH